MLLKTEMEALNETAAVSSDCQNCQPETLSGDDGNSGEDEPIATNSQELARTENETQVFLVLCQPL
jgi:hypothetical protein